MRNITKQAKKNQLVNQLRQFENLWTIILGGSSGFGFAAVEKLSAHGMNIAVLYRETAQIEKTVLPKLQALAEENEVRILPFNINALDENGRSKFIDELSKSADAKHKVRLLLHSIARGNLKPLIADNISCTLTADDIAATTYAMSNSLIDWTRLLMKENLFCDDARVIGLTSDGAHKYWDGYAAVSIAKSSLESLATYMAVEFARYGLRTNLIQAGITETPSLKKIPDSEKLIGFANTINPFKRITTPQDVANAIYLLCTNEAAWINGALLHVDGGEHCR